MLFLPGVLLVGLLLNSTLGWFWADPLAALVIAGVAVREGLTPGAARGAARQLPVRASTITRVSRAAAPDRTDVPPNQDYR